MTPPARRAIVTGGAGFVGSHLIDRLRRDGAEVVCIDSMITGRAENLAHLEADPGFTLIERDVTTSWDVDGPVDAVLHLASPASPVDYQRHPVATLDVGTIGTRRALELAREKRARFLIASTSEVYGDPLVHPQVETYWGNVNPVGPRSMYDESKRAAEAYVMAFHRSLGVDTRIARIFNTYGPRMRSDDGRAVPQFITQALSGEPLTVYGDGSQTRSLCYVDDLVDGLVRLLDSDYHEPVNLGNPNEMTMRELAETIRRVCDSASAIETRPLPVDDPRRRCPDISRAQTILGWRPTVPLQAGLERTVTWWRNEAAGAAAPGGVLTPRGATH
ncbi:MAG TPA: UDP-glucuronic acid decarboxylase family protein [Candidatus Dormibacteraeota bacterium]